MTYGNSSSWLKGWHAFRSEWPFIVIIIYNMNIDRLHSPPSLLSCSLLPYTGEDNPGSGVRYWHCTAGAAAGISERPREMVELISPAGTCWGSCSWHHRVQICV